MNPKALKSKTSPRSRTSAHAPSSLSVEAARSSFSLVRSTSLSSSKACSCASSACNWWASAVDVSEAAKRKKTSRKVREKKGWHADLCFCADGKAPGGWPRRLQQAREIGGRFVQVGVALAVAR